MNIKRILSRLRLDKIAAVDVPCQEGALAVFIKRAADLETILKAKYNTDDRKEMASNGEAMEDGSYPIKDSEDLENAIHAVGRGRNNSHAAIRRHIMSRAKSLGLEDKIPDTWKDGAKMAKSLYDAFEKSGVPLDAACDPDESAQAFDEVLGEQQLRDTFWDTWYKGTSALQESVLSILKDDDVADKSVQISESLKQFADYVETILPGDVGKALATEIVASAGQAGTPLNKGDVMSVELKKALGLPETATEADVLKAIADKDAAIVKANEDLEKAKAPPADDDDGPCDEDMKKALASGDAFRTPEGVVITKKAVGDSTFAVLKSQNDRLVKTEADLAKAREADEERSFAKRAEDLGCAPEFGSTLRKAYAGDTSAQAELEKQIKGLNEQIDKGALIETFGKSGEAGTATAEFTAKVEEVKKADPKLTDPQAYSKVYTDRTNRDLVKRMNDEQRAAAA
jgi:hypothetical protein